MMQNGEHLSIRTIIFTSGRDHYGFVLRILRYTTEKKTRQITRYISSERSHLVRKIITNVTDEDLIAEIIFYFFTFSTKLHHAAR